MRTKRSASLPEDDRRKKSVAYPCVQNFHYLLLGSPHVIGSTRDLYMRICKKAWKHIMRCIATILGSRGRTRSSFPSPIAYTYTSNRLLLLSMRRAIRRPLFLDTRRSERERRSRDARDARFGLKAGSHRRQVRERFRLADFAKTQQAERSIFRQRICAKIARTSRERKTRRTELRKGENSGRSARTLCFAEGTRNSRRTKGCTRGYVPFSSE